jgi:hypothetical protein
MTIRVALGHCLLDSVFVIGICLPALSGTRVSGTVRSASGGAVKHAYVEAIPINAENGEGTIGNLGNPWVAVNSMGEFTLSLEPGRYRIRAKDEEDGYPDPSFWLGLDPAAKFPEISVGNNKVGGVEVVLGTRGAILSGEVLDITTRDVIPAAKIRIQDAQNENAFVEVFSNRKGRFTYTIPSKPVFISVSAPGYRTNRYENGDKIILQPGEHREINIELARK